MVIFCKPLRLWSKEFGFPPNFVHDYLLLVLGDKRPSVSRIKHADSERENCI